jgi:hypothetical protein
VPAPSFFDEMDALGEGGLINGVKQSKGLVLRWTGTPSSFECFDAVNFA